MKGMYRFIVVAALLVAVVVGMIPTSAQAQGVRPHIDIEPTWRPALQLTTVDGGVADQWDDPADDFRYVEADIMVTTSVEFWAMEMTCTVNKGLVEGYEDVDSGPMGWHDDQAMVEFGDVWWWNGDTTAYAFPYDPATGKMTFVATKMGTSTPIGTLGEDQTYKVATLRYRVQEKGPNFSANLPLNCVGNFLDRDGKRVRAARYRAPTPVQLASGYSIQGRASYQARANKAGIGVECNIHTDDDGIPDATYTATTNFAGAFNFNNVRDLGHVECRIFSNLTPGFTNDPTPDPDLYLSGWVDFSLSELGSFTILPVELKGGDLNGDGGIYPDDLALVTGNWMQNALGDVNGDGRTDKTDLAIVGGNQWRDDYYRTQHVLYGLTRGNNKAAYDSRIWLGDMISGAVSQLVRNAGRSQFLWPNLSQDGGKVAYVRSNGKEDTRQRTYELWVANSNGSGPKPVLRARDLGDFSAFAPSWSPDGTRIAFVKSFGQFTSDTNWYQQWRDNMGALSVVDANGRNHRTLVFGTQIFPPTWLNESTIVFGCKIGEPWDLDPANYQLCFYDLNGDWWDYLDLTDVPNGATNPVVMNSNLYYRWVNPGTYESYLRYAELEWGPFWPPNVPAYSAHPGWGTSAGTYDARPPGPVHTDVLVDNWGSGFQEPVGEGNFGLFYDVSWYGNNLMTKTTWNDGFENYYFKWGIYFDDEGGGPGTVCSSGGNGCYPVWDWGEWHKADSQLWDPWWDGDPWNQTEFHALRATVDFVP